MLKILGAVFIIAGCGGVGLGMCQNQRRIQRSMEQLAASLEWMAWELGYRMPPLSELCRGGAAVSRGSVSRVLERLAQELDAQLTPDASACMAAALEAVPRLPARTAGYFAHLGRSLGRFDLQGQVSELENTAARIRRELEAMGRNWELRLRNYQTLGLCAGAALVILFL